MSHLEEELELNSLEAPDELQIKTVTQQASQRSPKNPYQLATTAKFRSPSKPVPSTQTRPKTTRTVPAKTTTAETLLRKPLTPFIRFPTIPTQSIQATKKTQNQDLSTYPVSFVVKLTIPQRIVSKHELYPWFICTLFMYFVYTWCIF